MAEDNEYSDDIRQLLESLTNPRYATDQDPWLAPIVFNGVLQGVDTYFIAAQNDPHNYGVDTWTRAQSGFYGPIGPYVPYDPPPPDPIPIPIPPFGQKGMPPPGVSRQAYDLIVADLIERATIKERLEAVEKAVERLEKGRNARKG